MLRQQEEKRELIAREHSTVHLASRAASRMNMAPLGAPAGLISRTNSINSRRDLRSEVSQEHAQEAVSGECGGGWQ
jgi:hypothetical protein